MKNWGKITEKHNLINNDYWPVYLGNGSIGGIFSFFGTQEGVYKKDIPFFQSPLIPYIYHDAVWNVVGERVPLGRLRGYFGNHPDSFQDISQVKQALDIEKGVLTTEGKVEGIPYQTKTFIHREEDLVCLQLRTEGKVGINVFFELKSPFEKKEGIIGKDAIILCAEMEGWHLAISLASTSPSSQYVGYNLIGVRAKEAVDVFASFTVAKTKVGTRRKQQAKVIETTHQTVTQAKEKGWQVLGEEQGKSWAKFWAQSFVRIPDPHLEKFYHASLFYLAQSIGSFGVSPVGLAVNGWSGRRFFDDLFMQMGMWFSNHVKEASKITEFRIKTSLTARELAKSIGFSGAVYPWESDRAGNERAPDPFLYQHSLSTGMASGLLWNQFLFTNEEQILRKIYPILLNIAQYATEIMVYDKKDRKYKLGGTFTEARNSFGINPIENSGNIKKALRNFYRASKYLGQDLDFTKKVKRIINNWSLPNDGSKYISFEEERDTKGNLLLTKGLKVRCGGQYYVLFPMQLIHQSDPLLPGTFDDVTRNLNYPHLPGFHLGALVTVAALLGKSDEALALIEKIAKEYILSHYVTLETPGEGTPYFMTTAGTVVTAVLSLFFYSNYDEILLFHAVPAGWKDIEFKNLRSHHALLISGTMEKGAIEKVKIVNSSLVKVNKKLLVYKIDPGSDYKITISKCRNKTERMIIKCQSEMKIRLSLEPNSEYILKKITRNF